MLPYESDFCQHTVASKWLFMEGTRMPMRALIVWGGWEGHEPEAVATIFAGVLSSKGYEVDVETDLKVFTDADRLAATVAS